MDETPRLSPSATQALDAARALSGLDARLVPSVMEALGGLQATKLGDFGAIREAVKGFDLGASPLVAPQIAEAMKAIGTTVTVPSFADALKGIDRPSTFNFAKALGDVDLGAVIQPQLGELVRNLNLSFGATAAEALKGMPPTITFAPQIEAATEEAVALAEVDHVADVIDAAVGRFASLTPANRRLLANDVALLVGAFLTLAGMLAGSGNPRDAGASLAVAATLLRIYWRLTGKLE